MNLQSALVPLLVSGFITVLGLVVNAIISNRRLAIDRSRNEVEEDSVVIGTTEKAVALLGSFLDRANAEINRLERALEQRDLLVASLQRELDDLRAKHTECSISLARLQKRISDYPEEST